MTREGHSTNLIWNRLGSTTEEMYNVASKLAFSSSIRDRADTASSICTVGGEVIGSSKRSTPVLSGGNLYTTRTILADVYPPETLSPGDTIVTNDPWIVGGHLSDVAVVNPVFRDGDVLCLCSSIGHVADIGGEVGGWAIGARDVYEEGIRVPPVKLYDGGTINEDVEQFLRNNVRLEDKVMGDIEALRSANTFGEARVNEVVDDFGIGSFETAIEDITQLSTTRLRRRIAEIDDGTYVSSGDWTIRRPRADPDITFTIRLRLQIDRNAMSFDFTGTSEQVSAGINCPLGNVRGMLSYVVRSMVLSDSNKAESIDDVFQLSVPEGSIINPRRPAPTGGRHVSLFPAAYCAINALGQACPDESIAWPGGGQRIVVNGTDERGEEFIGVNSTIPPWPARANKDGISCQAFPTNVKNLPIEVMELYTPLLVRSNKLVPDTEGAGRFRSGFAQELVVHNPTNTEFAASVTSGAQNPPRGVDGGQSGCPAIVETKNGEKRLPHNGQFSFEPGETIRLRSASGGGFGRPEKREDTAIEQDLDRGLLTPTRAKEVYEYE